MAKSNTFVLLIFAVAFCIAVQACIPPYCDNQDCGSCGNACCRLEFFFPSMETDTLATALNSTVQIGGPGGYYQARPLAEGGSGVASLKEFPVPVDYIGQAYHTSAIKHYVDTVDFTIEASTLYDGAILKMFSISQAGGSYCDEGQNYNNIMTLVTALGLDFKTKQPDGSCPPPADN
uniref:Uncharacterized protein n=1 Tax=Fibrocapsa japonica TaxID=94617 RepID=A0A7S2UYH6_9STRA|mmetsp:Transcript_20622/g.29841  ORF Transcript_20622/g.29841 Transcript_20622/m.29841 type:complete len:177 (+) Transcript_20622:75-605(+)|eukprot:CAMPEP_0113943604 /NCGR_PEP_ID=MMETSP1339-20121228/26921_1 /TAXON_ID=94617 /ORGANISM="Fibrocapsa japonica" /LENGTH=176 /DNA_ID=CAMNT_0000948525 /DNA_START=42 /DNA_END=572 /DNA_ORIENTATION=- /assembly_acc=CAM_ASM_000762